MYIIIYYNSGHYAAIPPVNSLTLDK